MTIRPSSVNIQSMKKFLWILCAAILAGSGCSSRPVPLQGAVITAVRGNVSLQKSAEVYPVTAKDLYTKTGLLLPGMTLVTAKDAQVDLQFSSGTKMRIGACSSAKLESAAIIINGSDRIALRLESGSILSNVAKQSAPGQFTVQTPTALAGVRGTEFMIEEGRTCEPGSSGSVTRVSDGAVEVSGKDGKPVLVESGKKVTADANGTRVEAMPNTERDELHAKASAIEAITEQGKQMLDSVLKQFPENDANYKKALEQPVNPPRENPKETAAPQASSSPQAAPTTAPQTQPAPEAPAAPAPKPVEQGQVTPSKPATTPGANDAPPLM